MGVDKFGRYTSGKSRSKRGPKGEGFILTPQGDYDIQNKRLKNVHEPNEDGDAINLKNLNSELSNVIKLTDDRKSFDAQSKKITNSSDPEDPSDLVTASYLHNQTPIRDVRNKNYSVHQFNIRDVGYPKDNGDAVNLKYVKDNCLVRGTTGIYDTNGASITGLQDPKKGSDVATKLYVDSKTPRKTQKGWLFSNRRLSDIGSPVDPSDAVSLDYLNKNALASGNTLVFDAKHKFISNVAGPRHMDDVVSKRFLKEAFGDLGYTIYKNIHKGRAEIEPPDQWKSKVLVNSWDDLFK